MVSLSHTGLSPSSATLSRRLPLDFPLITSRLTPNEAPQPRPHIADGLGCSPFARHYSGNLIRFLFLGVLRWFTSPGWLICNQNWLGCPIRESSDRRLFTPPRSFSQFVTPFIASWCLGIRRRPLVAWRLTSKPVLFRSSTLSGSHENLTALINET